MRKKVASFTSLLFAVLFFAISVFAFCELYPVYAGISPSSVLNNDSIDGKIDPAEWWYPVNNKGVSYDDGISFDGDSTSASRLIALNKIENLKDAGYTKLFAAEFDFTVSDLPDGTRFGFVFGLSSLSLNPAAGAMDSTFIYFKTFENKFLCGVSNFEGASKTERAILEAKNTEEWISDKNASFTLRTEVNTDGGLKIKLIQNSENQTDFYNNAEAECFTGGFVGFGQIGNGSVVKITSVQVDALTNVTPENADIVTRFENDTFNLNALYTRFQTYSGRENYIKPEDGKMVFKNVKNGYLATRKSYSNFEMEAEICNLQRMPVFDDSLNLLSSISTGFSIAVGGDYRSGGIVSADFYVSFIPTGGNGTQKPTATAVTLTKNRVEVIRLTLPDAYHFWSERISEGRDIDIKAVMKNNLFSLYIKYGGQLSYYKALEYDNMYAPTGNVMIASRVSDVTMGICDNFKIGMFSIVNTDYNRKIVSLLNKDHNAVVYDYDYLDSWSDADLQGGTK